MKPKIEFLNNFEEITLPLIRLTKSKNGKTGTATFLFKKPCFLEKKISEISYISNIQLVWDDKIIISNDLKVFFRLGKPFLVRAIFLFKNSQEWFEFLNFMSSYSKETGLVFSEEN